MNFCVGEKRNKRVCFGYGVFEIVFVLNVFAYYVKNDLYNLKKLSFVGAT